MNPSVLRVAHGLIVLLSIAGSTACGGSSGAIDESDGGRLLIYRVGSVTTGEPDPTTCSDTLNISAGTMAPLALVTLDVSDDASEARYGACEEDDDGDLGDCNDVEPALVLDVTSPPYEGVQSAVVPFEVGPPNCNEVELASDVSIDDSDGQLRITRTVTLALVGGENACANLEADLVAASTNGLGLEGCTVTGERVEASREGYCRQRDGGRTCFL